MKKFEHNLRASSPKFKTLTEKTLKSKAIAKGTKPPTLGPLIQLTGKWIGEGLNVIALPDFNGRKKFRVQLNAISETLSFYDDVGPIPNRGNTQPDIFYAGLRYLQEVSDRDSHEGLHIEPGLWAFLPANTVQKKASVVRMGTVPHGDSLLAQGDFFTFDGAPKFGIADATPFTLDPKTGARINDTSPTYMKPYTSATPPPRIPKSAILNPNVLLQQSNDALTANGRKIVNTVVLNVNASAVGGINGTPVTKEPGKEGGIVNIPFVVKNADANSMSAIFWINTIQNPDGSQFLQLQYTQTVILDFPVPGPNGKMFDVKWPHITVGTLTKR